MRLLPLLALALASSLPGMPAGAAPLRPDHPLIGTWAFAIPGAHCTETITFLAGGMSAVTSGDEISEATVEISDTPAASGFYKWVDTVTRSNGGKDCAGGSTPVGDVATNYIRLLGARDDRFAVCTAENPDECYGPYVRQAGSGR